MAPDDLVSRLSALDPTRWATGLSAANARAGWDAALSCLDDRPRGLIGTPPRAVLLIASGNVFTAPIEWVVTLREHGVRVLWKPAAGHESMATEIAAALGARVRTWAGGDVAAEAEAMAGVDGVIAFGQAATLRAIQARVPPGVTFLGFGPRFGVSVVQAVDERTVLDHALYDGRGCMSPAAVFARDVNLDAIAGWMADAELMLPRGALDAAEQAAIRGRVTLARAVGERRSGAGWAVLRMPHGQFSPVALPRVMVVHRFVDVEEVRATLAPHRAHLGTVATDLPGLFLGAPRMCGPGRMQFPNAGRRHDGVDAWARLWR